MFHVSGMMFAVLWEHTLVGKIILLFYPYLQYFTHHGPNIKKILLSKLLLFLYVYRA